METGSSFSQGPKSIQLVYHKEVDSLHGIYVYDLELEQERRLVGASTE